MCLRNIWMVPLPLQGIARISIQRSSGLSVSLHFTVAAGGKVFLLMHSSMFSSSPLGQFLWPSQTKSLWIHRLSLAQRKPFFSVQPKVTFVLVSGPFVLSKKSKTLDTIAGHKSRSLSSQGLRGKLFRINWCKGHILRKDITMRTNLPKTLDQLIFSKF